MVPLWMWPMAVACGNTFMLKPSERDPRPLFIASWRWKAGLPPGVLNVVNGDKDWPIDAAARPARQGRELCGLHPIAEYIYAEGCRHGKRVQAWAAPRTTPC